MFAVHTSRAIVGLRRPREEARYARSFPWGLSGTLVLTQMMKCNAYRGTRVTARGGDCLRGSFAAARTASTRWLHWSQLGNTRASAGGPSISTSPS